MSNQPPIEVPQGAIRLNTDSQKLEFYAQDRWFEMATESISLDGGNGRGVAAGGNDPGQIDTIQYITIPTQGNATDFGDLTAANYFYGTASNNTRAVWVSDGSTNVMEFVTIATTGNASDFGDQNGTPQHLAGVTSDSHGGIS